MLLVYVVVAKLLWLAPFLAVGLIAESLASRRRVPAQSAPLNLGVMVLHWVAFAVITSTVTVAAIRVVGLLPRPSWLPQPRADTWLAFVAWTVFLLLFLDFLYYWMHRAQHMVPTLWAQHAVHHSDEHFNITTAWRTHWTEPLLELAFMVIPSAYLFAGQPMIAVVIGLASDSVNAFAHLNVPTRWRWLHYLLITPQLHRAHHSYLPHHIDRNFAGKFPIWDRLFGSFQEPNDAADPPTGLHNGEQILTLRDAALYPVRAWTNRNP